MKNRYPDGTDTVTSPLFDWATDTPVWTASEASRAMRPPMTCPMAENPLLLTLRRVSPPRSGQ